MASIDRLPSEVTIYLRDDRKEFVPDWALEAGGEPTSPVGYLAYCTVSLLCNETGARVGSIETTWQNERHGERHDPLHRLSVDADFTDELGRHIVARGIVFDLERDGRSGWGDAMLRWFGIDTCL